MSHLADQAQQLLLAKTCTGIAEQLSLILGMWQLLFNAGQMQQGASLKFNNAKAHTRAAFTN